MNWQSILISVVTVIATALAGWGVAKFTAWIDSEVTDTKANTFLKTAMNVVMNVVKQTYQTYVQGLKDTNAFTKEAQEQALTGAITTAKKLLSGDVVTFIKDNYGDVEEWLKTQIESTIYTLKNGGAE